MIIISRNLKARLSHLSTLHKYLEPVKMVASQASSIPQLRLKSHEHLLSNWWSQKPFKVEADSAMPVPLFSFLNGQYLGKQLELPQEIFNYPLRRDLIYRLYDFRIKLNKFTSKKTRNRAETHGSGRKLHKQKGLGMARIGDRRAPHLYKGGKAHGAKPKVYSYPLNAKVKINALKALFSAKLAQGKLKIVDAENLSEGKTKHAIAAFSNHVKDDRAILCVITKQKVDRNFELAQRNIQNVLWHDSYSLDVLSLFKADKILITHEGLEELIENINKTIYVAYRHPSMSRGPSVQKQIEGDNEEQFDPSQPYEFKFKILAEYLDKYKKLQREKPHLVSQEQRKIRRIDQLL